MNRCVDISPEKGITQFITNTLYIFSYTFNNDLLLFYFDSRT